MKKIYLGLLVYFLLGYTTQLFAQKKVKFSAEAVELNEKGNRLEYEEDYEGAIEAYTQAIELTPEYAVAYYNRANLERMFGENQEALEDYNTAIRIDPAYKSAYLNRGVVKADLKDYEGALADYNKAIKIDSRYSFAYFNRGVLKSYLGDYEGEIEDYRICMRIARKMKDEQTLVTLSNNLGRALHDLKRYQEAEKAYTEGIEINPQHGNGILYYGRGFALYRMGDTEGAREDWLMSRKLGYFVPEGVFRLLEN